MFWQSVFRSLGTRLTMSTFDHPETDGQTQRVIRVLEEILRGYVQSYPNWSEFLPMVEFAINNSVHASTTHKAFFVNGLRHPRILTQLEGSSSLRRGGGWTRTSKPSSGSCSSRVVNTDDASDIDVESIDIERRNYSSPLSIPADPRARCR